jgi:RNA polymerase sigma-70 factor (ECF subfamily)
MLINSLYTGVVADSDERRPQSRHSKRKRSAMEVTELLRRLHVGDNKALDAVVPLLYNELKKLASAHLRGRARVLPLETTALVHEAFMKLARGGHPCYENRSHFYGIASRVMRQVLVDTARARFAGKRGAALEAQVTHFPDFGIQPDRSVLALNDALEQLEKADPLKGRIIEMRYFGGLTAEQSATQLSIPVHVVRREMRLAHAWLGKEMAAESESLKFVNLDASKATPERVSL